MSLVKGNNVVVFIKVLDSWTPYVCARNATINITSDFIETSVSGTGVFATFLPTKISFTISMDGVVSLFDTGVVNLSSLRAKQFAQELLLVSFERTDDDGHVYAEECSAYISSSSDTGNYLDMDTFSIEMRGSGLMTQVFTSITEDMIYQVYTAFLNQSGTADPVATVLQNTLSAPIVWTRQATGDYLGTLAVAFTSGKTFFLPANGYQLVPDLGTANFKIFIEETSTGNTIRLATYYGPIASAAATDAMLINFPIEVRVYP